MSRSLLQLATECRVDGSLFGFSAGFLVRYRASAQFSSLLTPYSSPSKELS